MGAAKIAFCGLHRNVTKQELNLLQLAASGPAKPGTAAAEIVRRELAHADFGSELLDDVPDELFGHALAPNSASATHAAKKAAGRNSSGFRPLVKETLCPIRNRDGSNVTSLPTKVYDCPMPFALLNMIDLQTSEFVTPKSANQKDSK